jgi:hypothetical protein
LNRKWFVGFVDGEGHFGRCLIRNETMKFGFQIQPTFVVTQNARDVDLLYAFAVHFGCGYVSKNKGKNDKTNKAWMWRVRDIGDLCNIIIPFFQKHN